MDKPSSIVDVARHAGVSVSTVSLVMNNRPNVAPDTARAVWQAVKALGYRPGGGTGRKRGPKPGPRRPLRVPRLLLLQTGYPAAFFHTDTELGLLHGFQAAAVPGLAELILWHTSEVTATDLLRRSRADGVLVTGRVVDPRLREVLSRIPCVEAFGAVPTDALWDHVSADSAAAARCAGRWLAQRGHQHCVAVQPDARFAKHAQQVLRQDVERRGGTVREITEDGLVCFDGIFPETNTGRLAALFATLMAASPAPTGIILGTDVLAGPLYWLCRERGLQPGRDMDVLCSSVRGPSLAALRPTPAVIDLHPAQVGRQAVEQLLWRVEHRNEPRVIRLIAPSLV